MSKLMMFLIAVNVGTWILIYFLLKRIKKNDVLANVERNKLAGQIATLSKTVKEWDESRQIDIKVLNKTTIKATENAAGELVITSPDGTYKINEFKIKKN